MTIRKWLLFIFIIACSLSSIAQYNNTVPATTLTDSIHKRNHSVGRTFIPPAIMTGYGFIALNSHGLKSIDEKFQEEIWANHPHKLQHVDTYFQFVPAFSVFALNAIGIRGKNNFRDISLLYILSNIFLNSAVSSIKSISHRQRPDMSDYLSFPSGHTAEAFASAEFMRQEYKDVSPWYGFAGYIVAATTGYLRMYNNKHWFSDVIGGAGIGIASTKFAYWLYPKIQRLLFKKKPAHTIVMPAYQNRALSINMVHRF
jgi:membrane-associated phospholipid phosphatase